MTISTRKVSIYLASILAVGALPLAGAFASSDINHCSVNLPAAVQYEITSLSIIRGGGNLLSSSNDEAIENELCAQFKGYSIEEAKAPAGYSKIVVNFENETCSQIVQLSAGGLVGQTDGGIFCQAN